MTSRKEIDPQTTLVASLGAAKITSPLAQSRAHQFGNKLISDEDRILVDVTAHRVTEIIARGDTPASLELAGPREKIYFDPSKLRCAVVTCGGLCPGLNDIIRAIVLQLYYGYGVRNIYGIRYGLEGFIADYGHEIMDLTPQTVANIHQMGGTILGSSRGPQPIDEIIDCLERMNIGTLFMVGGDGTLKAASAINTAITARKLHIAVVAVPKTIDNDIYMVSRSFGFDTAVSIATQAVVAAHNESAGYPNGISLIKLMGRHSGYIAATTALARQDVNFVLIPEVEFDLEGSRGLFSALETRLAERGHAVIVVAEGAGQRFFANETEERDVSGNLKLKDIGPYLKQRIQAHFDSIRVSTVFKYIDPSYMIRSLPASTNDNVFCSFLGRDAVHAALAGKTGVLISHWNGHFVHVPMGISVGQRKQINPQGRLWRSVLYATGQGSLKNDG
ncbi:MAG: ATP-dependent 6-phosphofructokinase [Desulfobacterales bacterium]